MGLSVPAAFAVLLMATLVSFGVLYVSSENAYSLMRHAAEDYNQMVLKAKTSELELTGYSYSTQPNVTVYDITFNITNEGSILSPVKWVYIYNGGLTGSKVLTSNRKYLLPGEWIGVTVQNLQKDRTQVHSLVISTEVGCALKIKWEWIGNATSGSPQVISSAWYCPVEG
ncbi:MAG: hypothetical protein J7L37_09250 [Thermococcus sp.]|nr:hypothetical protein [Thermococcus sp.]